MHPSIPVLVLAFSSVGWGLTWIPLKYLNNAGLAEPLLLWLSFLASFLIFLPFAIKQLPDWKNALRPLLFIALIGGLASIAFQSALLYGNVIRVMILFYLLPVWSVIGGRIFLNEAISPLRVAMVVLALTGAFLILGGNTIFTQPLNWIDLLALASGFCFSMNNIIFRATQTVPVITKIAFMGLGCVILSSFWLMIELSNLNTLSSAISAIPVNALWVIVGYGFVWLTATSIGSQWAVTRIEAGKASIIMVLELVAATVSAALILGERLTFIESIGGLLILLAVLIESLPEDFGFLRKPLTGKG